MTPQQAAKALRLIADRLDLVMADDVTDLYVSLNIQPHGWVMADEDVIHTVDVVGMEVLDQRGLPSVVGSGAVHHASRGAVDGLVVSVFGGLLQPTAAAHIQPDVEPIPAGVEGTPIGVRH